jgi:hypothetical protein
MARNQNVPVAVRMLVSSLASMPEVVKAYGLVGAGFIPCKYFVHELPGCGPAVVPAEIVGQFGPDFNEESSWFLVTAWLEGRAKVQGYVASAAGAPFNAWAAQATFIRSTQSAWDGDGRALSQKDVGWVLRDRAHEVALKEAP